MLPLQLIFDQECGCDGVTRLYGLYLDASWRLGQPAGALQQTMPGLPPPSARPAPLGHCRVGDGAWAAALLGGT
eukprot:COSAG06_NODE_37409_length_435_cov_1.148810_2_plen_73_part_01